MFGRKKPAPESTSSDAIVVASADVIEEPELKGRPAPKGRPTPKRRDQEALRRKPLVPADRDAAKRESKQQARADRIERREAMARGDEKALPPRDRGPVRKFIRDAVDSRLTMGELVMPLVLVMLAISLLQNTTLQAAMLIAIWVVVAVGILDAVVRWYRIKKAIRTKFGTEPPKESAAYAVMRSFQMRMTRMPRPAVKRGAKVL